MDTFGSNITSTLVYPPDGTTPLIGSTFKEFPESKSPWTDCLSNVKANGTYYKFFNDTVSLFLPPINRGPKLILPMSKNTLG